MFPEGKKRPRQYPFHVNVLSTCQVKMGHHFCAARFYEMIKIHVCMRVPRFKLQLI